MNHESRMFKNANNKDKSQELINEKSSVTILNWKQQCDKLIAEH
jgi:hypothetical protein